jgi:NAD-dependent deacetylase
MKDLNNQQTIEKMAAALNQAQYAVAFTGAGISVESGIPTFRGKDGIWNRYDPISLDLTYFYKHPQEAWGVIKEIFYDMFGAAHPNPAHLGLAQLEQQGRLKAVITQNIDNLHQEAGNTDVIEYHGTCANLICTQCGKKVPAQESLLTTLPPRCKKCNGVLKPDFVFFGELIPPQAQERSWDLMQRADLVLIIGTIGEVMPACQLPSIAKANGATILEINPEPSAFTWRTTDLYLPMQAGQAMPLIMQALKNQNS